MIRSLISLLIFAVLFVLFGSSLFSMIGKFFYWIASLIEQTGYVSVWDKITSFFGWG